MDRVEVDADGAVVVVDLKTGKTEISGEKVRQHAQLGAYQLAVAHGAVDDLLGHQTGGVDDTAARPGGAELVYLRQPAGKASPDVPKVRRQDAWEPDPDGAPTTPEQQVQAAVQALRGERFHARPNEFCTSCEFRTLCPAQADGLFVLSAAEEVADERD
jgi:RecB family exonuclease